MSGSFNKEKSTGETLLEYKEKFTPPELRNELHDRGNTAHIAPKTISDQHSSLSLFPSETFHAGGGNVRVKGRERRRLSSDRRRHVSREQILWRARMSSSSQRTINSPEASSNMFHVPTTHSEMFNIPQTSRPEDEKSMMDFYLEKELQVGTLRYGLSLIFNEPSPNWN